MDTPKQVGPFRVLRELGRGGMGGVFLAEDPRLGRKVALKILLPSRQDGSQGTVRLLKEAKAAAKLDHPNVCAIYEVGESESGAYIAMQYVEGETIDAVLARSRPSLREVVSWGVQVAEALAEAHRLGIIHRDIKPQNLMVTPKGHVKVLDFGLAKLIAHGTQPASTATLLTQEGIIMGTVPYMSPEQVKSEPLDGRSDLFSLGAVLFEAATGRRPFPAANSAELMSEILLKDPFWDGAGDHLPPELHAVLAMALQKKKADRYTSAEAMAGDLRAVLKSVQGTAGTSEGPFPSWLSGSSSERTPASSSGDALTAAMSSQGWPPPQRKARNWWLMAGLGLALTLPVAYFAVPAIIRQGLGIDSIAVLPIANAANDPEMDYLCDGLTEQIINQLSRLPRLKVIARSSILRYKGQTPDLKALAKELGVKAILTGRLGQKNGQLTLSVELAETANSRHLWGDQIVRPMADLIEIQNGLARDISQHLGRTLQPEEQRVLAAGRLKVDPEAYQLYLKGKNHQDKWTPQDFQKAIGYYDQALAKDPRFALAAAAKALAYWNVSSQFFQPVIAMAKVREGAQLALSIDPELPEAHAALAGAKAVLDHDFAGAEASFKRALELDPKCVIALEYYAYILIGRGRTQDALALLERAKTLDPMSPLQEMFVGWAYMWAKKPDFPKATEHFRASLAREPEFWWSRLFLGWCLDLQGKPQEADPEVEKAKASGSSFALGYSGYRMAKVGNKAGADAVLTELLARKPSPEGYPSPHHIAMVYAGFGDKDKTMEWLEKAYKGREEPMMFMENDHTWDPLRNHPRFETLKKRIDQIN